MLIREDSDSVAAGNPAALEIGSLETVDPSPPPSGPDLQPTIRVALPSFREPGNQPDSAVHTASVSAPAPPGQAAAGLSTGALKQSELKRDVPDRVQENALAPEAVPPVSPSVREAIPIGGVELAGSASLQPPDLAAPVQAQRAMRVTPPPPQPRYNALVLKTLESMPQQGKYAASRPALAGLREATKLERGRLKVAPKRAVPSFCSGATYLVFLETLLQACDKERIKITEPVATALLVAGQSDGQGVWGRWNANGPGTARLFFETGLGINFETWEHAQPGDFMKVFWNEHIGRQEHGHSVVFLGLVQMENGETGAHFWSSNNPEGYGRKVVPLSRVKRVLFSRLTNPAAITRLNTLPTKDPYLADMLKRDSTGPEMLRMVGAEQ